MKKIIFILFHSLFDLRFYPLFLSIKNNNKKTYSFLVKQQEIKLRKITKYVYKYIPYYKELFDKNNIKPSDIKKLSDLQKIPILTKEIINKNIDKFKPKKKFLKYIHYFNNSTGGTTGTPFEYKMSRYNRLISGLLTYRLWTNAGYKMGDRMIVFAGSSLGGDSNSILDKFITKMRNIIKLSAFDMDDEHMEQYISIMNKYQAKFIYGYPSALYFFSTWVEKTKNKIPSLKAIFTTSETLFPYMRKKIEKTFKCKIFDAYGLNDGGVSCCECVKHKGMHIDMERSVFEVVNENIIATDLDNYVFPFIRYDTGDVGKISKKHCSCGINTPIIEKILGRSVDVLLTPEGKKIHGWLFLYIFWKYNKGIEKYQVIQENINNITIKIVKNKDFDKNQINILKKLIKERSNRWKITFKFVKNIELSKSGKQKFIINKVTK